MEPLGLKKSFKVHGGRNVWLGVSVRCPVDEVRAEVRTAVCQKGNPRQEAAQGCE